MQPIFKAASYGPGFLKVCSAELWDSERDNLGFRGSFSNLRNFKSLES